MTSIAARHPDAPALGLRERNKHRKEMAIRNAARSLFQEKGYEATTLRAVAEKADVGFGTVFSYAVDKPGLLAMVYVEELKALPSLFPPERTAKEPIDEIVDGFGQLYEFWARTPQLSLHVLQQMEFYSRNPHMELIVARRRHAQLELANWVRRLQDQGRVSISIDATQVALTLFAIYTSAVRDWTATTPGDVSAGLTRLRYLLELPLKALCG